MNIYQSDFDYGIADICGKTLLWITDLDFGGKSITNNIENIVLYLTTKLLLNPADCLVIYRDSDGIWDGWEPTLKHFISLNQPTIELAIIQLMERGTRA